MRVLLKSAAQQADFSEVLDEACRTAGFDPDTWRVAASPSISRKAAQRLHRLAEHERVVRSSMQSASVASYLENASEMREAPVVRPADPKAISLELSITARMSRADLRRLRRAFARVNHPDCVGASERETATRRMMIANMLIDSELKRRHTQ
jgi:hypothetical protein